jgi:hypothetical protein
MKAQSFMHEVHIDQNGKHFSGNFEKSGTARQPAAMMIESWIKYLKDSGRHGRRRPSAVPRYNRFGECQTSNFPSLQAISHLIGGADSPLIMSAHP